MGVDNRTHYEEIARPNQEEDKLSQPDQSQKTEKHPPQEVIQDACNQMLEIADAIESLKETDVFSISPELQNRSQEYQKAMKLWQEARKEVVGLVDQAASAIKQVKEPNERLKLAMQVVEAVEALNRRTSLLGDVSDVNTLKQRVIEAALPNK